jgi:hypothetical protein
MGRRSNINAASFALNAKKIIKSRLALKDKLIKKIEKKVTKKKDAINRI